MAPILSIHQLHAGGKETRGQTPNTGPAKDQVGQVIPSSVVVKSVQPAASLPPAMNGNPIQTIVPTPLMDSTRPSDQKEKGIKNTGARPVFRPAFKYAYPSYKDMDMGYQHLADWKRPRFNKLSAEVAETTIRRRFTPRGPARWKGSIKIKTRKCRL